MIGGILFGAAFLVFAAIVFKRGASGSTGTRRRDEDQQDLSSPDGLLGKVLSHCDLHDLFADPPPRGECPVCFSVLPLEPQHSQYMECCGKVICRGCMHEQERVLQTINPPCSFCRTERPFDDAGIMERLKDRAEKGDARAALILGGCYNEGDFGLPTNKQHTLELWKRAADLGLADACYFLAYYFTPPCITLTPQGTARKPNPGVVGKGGQGWECICPASAWLLGIRTRKQGSCGEALSNLCRFRIQTLRRQTHCVLSGRNYSQGRA